MTTPDATPPGLTSDPYQGPDTNNLHRELAPITPAAWAEIEEEARRTFRRNVAGRRVVDVPDPGGPDLAAVGTGHLGDLGSPAPGVTARLREAKPLFELRVPFTVDRAAVDDVERGSKDSDWQPVKDAARAMAFVEDRTIFDGFGAAGVDGLRARSSNPVVQLPAEPRDYPDAVSRALTALRLAGVDGPYALLLGADEYRAVSETSDHGYPIAAHLGRMLDGSPIWAPALSGGFVLSTRGGDFELILGQDLAIGYTGHDAESVHLYFQETLTFRTYTDEAVVVLEAPSA
ncbi:family 1 encapsulin nanocompartment shell protein [Streptomyces sp. NPDC056056]|uniref:family 1 encapsulin nanocompartment shell protein n=2 Tax=Streptomyces TaxID=1883 RepID=UPI0035E2DC2D